MSVNVLKVTVVCSLMLMMMTASLVRSAAVRPGIAKIKMRCSKNYKVYYDHGTRNCELCREICDHADIIGTTQQCNEYCPEYLKAMECENKEDKFFDDNNKVCTHCSLICDDHEYKQTTEECKEKCNGYLTKQTPEQVASLHKPNSLVLVEGSASTDSSPSTNLHPGWIAAIAVSCLAILCTTVVLIAFLRARTQYNSHRYTQASNNEEEHNQHTECPRQSAQPVEESTRDGPFQYAIESGISTLGQLALSDLGNRNESSRQDLAYPSRQDVPCTTI